MNQKSILIIMLFVLCCVVLLPQAEEAEAVKKDTMEITSLKAAPGAREGGVIGINIELEAAIELKDTSGVPLITAIVYDANGTPVKAAVKKSRYNIGGLAGSERMGFISKFPVKLSIPYYILDLKEGRHSLSVKISAAVRYGAKEPEKVECRGEDSVSLSIDKPAVRKFQVIMRELRVEERNLRDNNWDSGGRARLPDLRYKVELGSKATRDIVYFSSVVQNSLSAGWIDYSGVIAISEGDTVNIAVYDKDTMFDDPIGRKKLSLDELIKMANKGEKIHFGLVDSCLISVKQGNRD